MAGLRKILLVEDNAQLIEIYHLFLTQSGFEVAIANDGDQALDVAKEYKPDLIFLDVMMPKKDGFEVLKILRHNPEYNCTLAKIVMLTNLGDASKVSPQVHKDMDGYVIKAEIVLDDLLNIIKSLE
ncbi:MAG TPA: response regulator [Candidatus Saccharimonadales bacterium]|nr:response regulator [Candidatus Saccharimonadales bacterium]